MSLPLTVIGGYLGAGKTTVLNHLARQQRQVDTAILLAPLRAFDSIAPAGSHVAGAAGGR